MRFEEIGRLQSKNKVNIDKLTVQKYNKTNYSLSMHFLHPIYTTPSNVSSFLKNRGFCILDASSVAVWLNCSTKELDSLSPSWDNLPSDNYLKDGGHYRRRRHSSFVFENNVCAQVSHRAHWQPPDYNALHGGMERWFEPILDNTIIQPTWSKILTKLANTAAELNAFKEQRWCIEAHQFRIDTSDGIGRPTPEGAHRDGVDWVAVFMVNRKGIKGGETRVFEADGPHGERFTLSEPWSLLLLNDARMIHESTPIQPLTESGYRDTLVVTLRENFFQDPVGKNVFEPSTSCSD